MRNTSAKQLFRMRKTAVADTDATSRMFKPQSSSERRANKPDRPADTVRFAFHAAKIRMRRLILARRAGNEICLLDSTDIAEKYNKLAEKDKSCDEKGI